jgi:hypothetical protein
MRRIAEYQGAERRIPNPFMGVANELCRKKRDDVNVTVADKNDGAKTGTEMEMEKKKKNENRYMLANNRRAAENSIETVRRKDQHLFVDTSHFILLVSCNRSNIPSN